MQIFSEYIQSPIDTKVIHQELENDFMYYKNLNPLLKKRFLERISSFIQDKKFVARQNLEMTDKIRIIISACAIQVTFGLDSFGLNNFHYVVVYPDIYESPITKKMHKGETNLNGFICLSWKHVVDGIDNPNDNYNLAIHEWMHALRFNGINFEETDYFFDGYINKWVAGAIPEFNKLRAGKSSIFRRYGAANIHEFLSVCTEHFFESPNEFKAEVPEFFDEMCVLLNQVPSKNESAKIDVRHLLLNKTDSASIHSAPLLELEASFFRTLFNFGFGSIYFLLAFFTLLVQKSETGFVLFALLFMVFVFKMNSMYFTVRFYQNHVYIQKGFVPFWANRLTISYRCLMKMEIYKGNFDSYNSGTVFQLNYFSEDKFLKKVIYCSAINVPKSEIVSLLKSKKVAVLLPL